MTYKDKNLERLTKDLWRQNNPYKECEICSKQYFRQNFAKHTRTSKHIKNLTNKPPLPFVDEPHQQQTIIELII